MNVETNSLCTANTEMHKLLEDVAKQEGFQNYKIEKAPGSMKGDGYIGIITSIKIIGKDAANTSKVLNLVVKSASQSDALRTEVPVEAAFDREIYIYNTVFPIFRIFEVEKGLKPSSLAPKFYKANFMEKNEILVLKNLKESGYRLHERKIPMDKDHVSLVMRAYGRLHALSFALRDQNPEKFVDITENMDDVLIKFLKETFFDTISYRCTKALNSLDHSVDKEAIEVYKALIDRLDSVFSEMRESIDDYSVILHGDCWTNNMMFKYEENNTTKPIKVRFLDFQVSKVGSPTLDLVYFFYSCSSKEIINNLDYYMKVYYDSLSEYLLKLGSDPIKVFPYSTLLQHWKHYAQFGLIMSILAIHAMLSEKDETIDLKNIAESGGGVSNAFNYDISNVDEYNDRIRHNILHFVKNNFI